MHSTGLELMIYTESLSICQFPWTDSVPAPKSCLSGDINYKMKWLVHSLQHLKQLKVVVFLLFVFFLFFFHDYHFINNKSVVGREKIETMNQ